MITSAWRIGAGATLLAAFLVSGCTETTAPTPNVTNAPARGFASIKHGSEEDFILNVGRRTYFKEGSDAIDETARFTLDKQAEWLAANPGWKVKLQGFADDPGTEADNVALSAKRAEAVMAYLASKGVDRGRMWAKGYGKERIVRACSDITCKSQNRRVITNLRDEFDGAAPQAKN